MTNYERGARFENDVVKDFEEHGYIAIRAAGSHTPADVYAFKKDKQPIFIQCKRNGVMPPAEWNTFLDYCEQAGALPVMAMKPKRGIDYFLITGKKEKRGKQPMKGIELETY